MMAVAIPAPELPKKLIAKLVANAVEPILTTLLPMRIVEMGLPGCSNKRLISIARLFPSSARCRILTLFAEKMAVSDAEKKADKHKRITRNIN
jgi:hypothetical protein